MKDRGRDPQMSLHNIPYALVARMVSRITRRNTWCTPKGYNPHASTMVEIRCMSSRLLLILALLVAATATAVAGQNSASGAGAVVLRPARVFDGVAMHEGWAVRVV